MTISSTIAEYTYAGNGVTVAFPYPSRYLSDTDLVVLLILNSDNSFITLVLGTDYTIADTLVGGDIVGGVITTTLAPDALHSIKIYGNPLATQTTDLQENTALPARSLENTLDKMTLIIQRMLSIATRAIRVADSFVGSFNPQLAGILAPGTTIIVNPAGNGLITGPVASDVSAAAASAAAAAASAAAAAVSAASAGLFVGQLNTYVFTGDGVTLSFALPADPVTKDNVDINIQGVTQQKSSFSAGGSVNVVFNQAPPNGKIIEMHVWSVLPITSAIAAGTVTNALLATMPAQTVKANVTGGVASPTDVTYATLAAALGVPVPAITQLSGDVVAGPGSGSQVATIAAASVTTAKILANAVTNSRLAQMANNTLKGNNSGGLANPIDLTPAQAAAILPAFIGDSGAGGTQGSVPAPAAGDAALNKFLGAGGAWLTVASGGGMIATSNGTSGAPLNVAAAGLVPLLAAYSAFNFAWLQSIGAGNTTITSAPSINPPGAENQIAVLIGISDTKTVTLQDVASLGGSKLRLQAATRVLKARSCLALVGNNASGEWSEIFFAP